MHLSLYEQGEIFYYAFIFGMFVGLYYDFYRFLRYIGLNSKQALLAEDITFMCTTAVAFFLFSQVTVHGHIRLYVLLTVFFGAVAYRYSLGLLSGFVFAVLHRVLRLISKAGRKLFGLIKAVFERVGGKIADIYAGLCIKITQKVKSTKKLEKN